MKKTNYFLVVVSVAAALEVSFLLQADLVVLHAAGVSFLPQEVFLQQQEQVVFEEAVPAVVVFVAEVLAA